MKNLNIFFIVLIFSLNYSTEKDTLRWAFEIFRHGARTPYSGMDETFHDCFGHQWIGLKELTGVGLRQHFLVGYRNKLKYTKDYKLINPTYDPREVFLISTDTNRTVMSANAQVQGLFPPGEGPSLNKDQAEKAIPPVEENIYEPEKSQLDNDSYATLPNHMTVIPIHSFFNEEHFIQLQDKKVCPNSYNYYLKNQQREEVVNFLQKMSDKYGENLLKVMVNEKDKDMLKNYTKAYYIFDTIISEYTEGVDKFEEVCKELKVSKDELLHDSFKFFELDLIGNGIDNDKELCLHSMSPIFNRLLEWMEAKINKDKDGEDDYTDYDLPKFVMFSAHDSTCGAFMGFMKAVFNTEIKYPYFATNINLELMRKNDEKGSQNYDIEYIINDELIKRMSFDEFYKGVKSAMKKKEEIDKFCGFVEEIKESESSNVYLITNIILSIISIVLIVLIVITIRKKKAGGKSNNIEDINLIDPLNSEDN